MKVFGTVIRSCHINQAKALAKSLKTHDVDSTLFALVVDSDKLPENFEGIEFLTQKDLSDPLVKDIVKKYSQNLDELRWGLKAILLKELIIRYNNAIYLDCDICFFESTTFLFDKLSRSNIILTRHWRPITPPSEDAPISYRNQFIYNWTDGHFNAGFVAANEKATEIIDWWARACLFNCKTDYRMGIYVDQKYLDIVPIHFKNVEILEHQGCNVAEWNIHTLKRELVGEKVLICGVWPIIFIHFTRETIVNILTGVDGLLRPYLDYYFDLLGMSPENYFEDIRSAYPNCGLTKLMPTLTKLSNGTIGIVLHDNVNS